MHDIIIELHFGSLNLWGRKGNFEKRMAIVSDEIAKLKFDVIFFQEVLLVNGVHPLLTWLEDCGYEVHFFPTLETSIGNNYGNALISRIRADRVSVIKLPVPDLDEPRNAIFFERDFQGVKSVFVCTHLSHGVGQVRLRWVQLEKILSLSKDHEFVVIGGDFNLNSEELESFRSNSQYDFADPHDDDRWDMEYERHAKRNPDAMCRGITTKIDHIIFSDSSKRAGTPRVCGAGIFAYNPEGGIYPSDHIGISAELCFISTGY